MSDHPEKCNEVPLTMKVQPTFLRQCKRAAEYEGEEAVSAWIKKVVTERLAAMDAQAKALTSIFVDSE